MFSDNREEILEVIQQIYWIKYVKGKKKPAQLKLFGVSTKSLSDYVTSDKDLIRNYNRLPDDYFLLDPDASRKVKEANAVLGDLDDAELDDLFSDFVFIDPQEIENKQKSKLKNVKESNKQEKIAKEEETMKSLKSELV